MKKSFLLAIIFLGQLLFACNNTTKVISNSKVEIQLIDTTSFEIPPPPPSLFLSPTMTLKQWFIKFCNSENVGETVVTYRFGLFGTADKYAISLIGSTGEEKDVTVRVGKNSSAPNIKYYLLSKVGYEGLEWPQVLNKIKSQLKEFVKTEDFKNSLLAKAKSIRILFDDEDLLTLK